MSLTPVLDTRIRPFTYYRLPAPLSMLSPADGKNGAATEPLLAHPLWALVVLSKGPGW
jgi:hypothetical protein